MNKILTVVIPTYNMEELLPRCLDSLVKPLSSDELEVIVVNDGSSDNSLSIAQKYEKEYPEIIRSIDKENGNYGSAVNKGIELATGKYFRILDSDDFYDNSGLHQLINKLKKIDTEIVLTNFRRDRGEEKKYYRSPQKYYDTVLSSNDVDITLFPNFAMHAITYKTSILKDNNIRLQHGISYTDSEYCFYPLPYTKSFIALDILVYCYQIGRVGQTVEMETQLKSVPSMIKIIDRMYDYLKNTQLEDSQFVKLRKIYCDVNRFCFLSILCFDKSNDNLSKLIPLVKKIDNIPGAKEIMLNKNMFGIKFYERYVVDGKTSHGYLHSLYYKLVKKTIRIIRIYTCWLN